MDTVFAIRHHARALLSSRQSAQATSLAPPGVTPNYVNPESISARVTITSLTLMVITSIFVTTRLAIKWRIVKKWGWDDALISFAMLLIIARAIVCTINAENYGLGLHLWDIPPMDLITKGDTQKNLLFVGDMLYLVSIMCTKVAILMLYVQLFGVKRPFRNLCYAMMAVVVSYCTIFFFIEAFNCNPVEKVWHALTYKGEFKCFDNAMIEFVIGGFNIATDTILLIMPIPLIMALQMDAKHRWALLAVFGTGIFVVASTIVREIIVVRTLRDFDQSWVTVPETVWLTIENDIGVICACLPALAPLKRTRLFSKMIPSSVQYLLEKSGFSSTHKDSSLGSSSKASSKRTGYLRSESGVDLVEDAKPHSAIRSTTEMQVYYTKHADASDRV